MQISESLYDLCAQELKNNSFSLEKFLRFGIEYDVSTSGHIIVDLYLNTKFYVKVLQDKLASFQEIVNYFKDVGSLDFVLKNIEFFETLKSEKLIDDKDIYYALSKIDNQNELVDFCNDVRYISYSNGVIKTNTELLEYALKNFLIDEKLWTKFDEICKNTPLTPRSMNFQDFEELFQFTLKNKISSEDLSYGPNYEERESCNKDLEAAFNLSMKLRKFAFDNFNETEKQELIELVKNNEITLNRLKEIADNNLQSNYDFESLLNYLKKQEKKSVLNI